MSVVVEKIFNGECQYLVQDAKGNRVEEGFNNYEDAMQFIKKTKSLKR
jgi:hypothetical protein